MVEALRTIKVKQLSGPELNLQVNPDVSFRFSESCLL